MPQIIDLRSDTVTLPTASMYKAMTSADLGDDVLGDDPTVQKLEENAATLTGKDAALFVPSGTMGNLVSILVHCPRGSEIILGNKSHTFVYEAGGISAFGGVHSHQLNNQSDGTIKIDDIVQAIRGDNVHFPKTACIALENTHNICNGAPLPVRYLKTIFQIAQEHSLKVHTDGARIFNAAVSLDIPVDQIAKFTDSITFCLSKGLTAPVGSVVCGTDEFIYHARRIRKVLGGGMRQAGVLAAAGLVSLNEMTDQLNLDHQNLHTLAEGLAKIHGIEIIPQDFKTNILYFQLADTRISDEEFVQRMEQNGVRFFTLGKNRFRLVTHSGVCKDDILNAIEKFSKILGSI